VELERADRFDARDEEDKSARQAAQMRLILVAALGIAQAVVLRALLPRERQHSGTIRTVAATKSDRRVIQLS